MLSRLSFGSLATKGENQMATKKRGRRAPAKKSRARVVAPPQSKFVQIAVRQRALSDEDQKEINGPIETRATLLDCELFALDEHGAVWTFNPYAGCWTQIATERDRPYRSDDEEM